MITLANNLVNALVNTLGNTFVRTLMNTLYPDQALRNKDMFMSAPEQGQVWNVRR